MRAQRSDSGLKRGNGVPVPAPAPATGRAAPAHAPATIGNQARLRLQGGRSPFAAKGPAPAPLFPSALPRIGRSSDAAEHRADRRAAAALGRAVPGPTERRDPLGGQLAPPAVAALARQPGRALDPAMRGRMERGLGADLGGLRLHDGPAAAEASRAIGASAFTLGRHVAIDRDAVRPGTPQGDATLAHELAHASDAAADGATLRRQVGPPTLAQRYTEALAEARLTGAYGETARLLNGFSRADILTRIAPLPDEELARLHYAAINEPGVGAGAQVAELTNPARPRVSSVAPARSVARTPAPAAAAAPARAAARDPVLAMTGTERVFEAYRRADIGRAIREHLESLVTPQAIVLGLLAFVAVFAVSMLTPVGWAAGLTLALTTVFVGMALVRAIRHLIAFVEARNASSSADIDEAAGHFAAAVAELSIDLLILLITRGMRAGPGAAGPPPSPMPAAVRIAAGPGGAAVLVDAVTIPVAAIEAATVAAAPAPALAMAMSGGPPDRPPPARESSGGGGSRRTRAPRPPVADPFLGRLRALFPRLRGVDIRPVPRGTTGRYWTEADPSTVELGTTPRRFPAASGAPEWAFEERMLTGQGPYSYSVYQRGVSGPVIQIDGITLEGWLQEIKIEQSLANLEEILAQLRTLSRFAREYGLRGVEYSIHPPVVADAVEAAVAEERMFNTFRIE
jgi:hypothetical protein